MTEQKKSAGFFPRLATTRRQQDSTEIELNPRDLLLEEEEANRQHFIEDVTKECDCSNFL
jgi:hypothetical protein